MINVILVLAHQEIVRHVRSQELTHQLVIVIMDGTKKISTVNHVHINVQIVLLQQYVPYVQETENTHQIVLVN